MKFAVRTPSLSKSIKARTTGKAKRAIKRAIIPGYGKKGMGWVKNPKKAAYNSIYNKTTVSTKDLLLPNNPKSNKKMRKRDYAIYGNRELEILNDCAELLSSTKNPDTFFERYDLYFEKLQLLAIAEKNGIKFDGQSPSEKLAKMSSYEQQINSIKEFIDRYWENVCENAKSLKTEKGKENRKIAFATSLMKYNGKMPRECIEYYINKDNTLATKHNFSEHEYYAWAEQYKIYIEEKLAVSVLEKKDNLYVVLFGGWFGLHKYIKGEIGMGLLYTFTFGLFCIGWIVDAAYANKALNTN